MHSRAAATMVPRETTVGFERVSLTIRAKPFPEQFERFLLATGFNLDLPPGGQPFRVNAVRSHAFISAWISSSPVTASWAREHARAQGKTLFCFVNVGSGTVRVAGRTWPLRSGQAVAIASGTAAVELIAMEPTNEILLFSIDANIVNEPSSLRSSGLAFIDEPALVSFAFGACHGLAHASEPRTEASAAAMSSLAASVGSAVLAPLVRGMPDETDVFTQAEHYLRITAVNPDVNPTVIAQALGVSLRTLQASFARRGLTVSGELRKKRYENARAIIESDPALKRNTVARRAGFRSVKAMRDAFAELSADRAR